MVKENPVKMPKREELLKEFEGYSYTGGGVKALMQHVAQRMHEEMARYNWVGFYFMEAPNYDALVLGPYVGSFNPWTRIPLEKGLCGAAASSGQTVAVNNVAKDPRYIGSDLVKSNMIVPIKVKGRVVAELCIESYFTDTFDAGEQAFVEGCAELVGRGMDRDGAGQGR
jgi:L-methionine (R)-S-oxide reductase